MKFNASAWYLVVGTFLVIMSFIVPEPNIYFYIGAISCVILSRIEYLIKKIEEKLP